MMNELFIIIVFCFSIFVVIPFIVYSIMVFIDYFDNIHYMRDYIDALKYDEWKYLFTLPIVNTIISICIIFATIILVILKIITFIWKHIPKISIFENKCINIWKRFLNWFMNIKIK